MVLVVTVKQTSPSNNEIEGPYPTVVKSGSGNTVLIVQAMAFTKYLGHIKVNFTEDGQVESWQGMPILLDQTFEWASEAEKGTCLLQKLILDFKTPPINVDVAPGMDPPPRTAPTATNAWMTTARNLLRMSRTYRLA